MLPKQSRSKKITKSAHITIPKRGTPTQHICFHRHQAQTSQKILLPLQHHKTSLKLHFNTSSKVSISALTVTTSSAHPTQRCHLPTTKKPLPKIPPPPQTRSGLLNTPVPSLSPTPPLPPTPPPSHKPKYPSSCNGTSCSCPGFGYHQLL